VSKILVGSAPASWGVWFPDDPQQTPYTRLLDEVAESGYEWIESGPSGYLPTDPKQLSDELTGPKPPAVGGHRVRAAVPGQFVDAVWS
jgi:inosose dehydratase